MGSYDRMKKTYFWKNMSIQIDIISQYMYTNCWEGKGIGYIYVLKYMVKADHLSVSDWLAECCLNSVKT